eukprot:SAG31_NODE_777_length_12167_cov_6.570683_8_plen_49_part_00
MRRLALNKAEKDLNERQREIKVKYEQALRDLEQAKAESVSLLDIVHAV